MSLERDWPLFGLRVDTPRLTLTYPTDSDLDALNAVAGRGVHDPGMMPFSIPWTDASPELRPRNSLQHWWGLRATWQPNNWHLTLVVREGPTVVGVQDLFATNFAATRQAATGSWLGMEYQGRGIGKEMRAAVLHLAFAGLNAERATSGAFDDNPASLGVSRALGYVENGDDIAAPRGRPQRQIRLILTRQAWERIRRSDIRITGLEPCRSMFGLESGAG
ncbi:MAG TPA: GNAT family protein [Candidatus Dormibacteraeota bacterium]|nr:GNAT family protein [Candidatus Dormibacteraeota bacterium]